MTADGTEALSPAEITKQAGSNFSLSFAFLQAKRRRGISTIYAFCRAADDAVDEADTPEEGRERLEYWRRELECAYGAGEPQSELGLALRETVREFGVPSEHLRALCDGCEMDLEPRSYPDLESLEGYCGRVASAVGLACLAVFGVDEAAGGRYAERLGQALQLTNILRDLRGDAEIGRCYVPEDYLRDAGVEKAWLDGTGPTEAYADSGPIDRLVERLVVVARTRFDEARAAMPGDGKLRRRLIAAEIMGAVYAHLLDRVAARRGHIDSPGRLRISKPRKLALAFRTWLRGRRP